MTAGDPYTTRRRCAPIVGGSFVPDWVAALHWIGWQLCTGLGGSFALDWVAGITGIRTIFQEYLDQRHSERASVDNSC
jgi:hypothetical protein